MELPDRARRGGYVYVMKFSNGVVKVGQTSSPKTRLREHAASARRFDCTVEREWLSRLQARPLKCESSVLDAIDSRDGEWIPGGQFEHIVELAEGFETERVPERALTQRDLLSTRWLGIGKGSGRAAAIRLWPVLWSLVPKLVGQASPMIQIDMRDMVSRTGMHRDSVQRGMRHLCDLEGIRSTPVSDRRHEPLRLLSLQPPGMTLDDIQDLHRPFSLPEPDVVAEICTLVFERRVRGAHVVALAMSMFAYGSLQNDGAPIVGPVRLSCSLAALRDAISSHSNGSAFYEILGKLSMIGLIEPAGDQWRKGIILHPSPGIARG